MTCQMPVETIGQDEYDLRALVNTPSREALFTDMTARFREGRGYSVATLNLDHLVKLRRMPEFRRAYERHSHVVADGNPVVWLYRVMGRPVELVPGSELVEPIAALAAWVGIPVAMLGSTESTLERAAARLEAENPGLKVVARIAPPFGFDPEGPQADDVLRQVGESGAKLCFVALGAPKQERLAVRGTELLPDCGFVSVGAGLDFIAGTQTRAPKWVRRIAMEWLWRLLSSPARLARRYFDCIVALPGLFWSAWRVRRSADR